MGNTVQGFLHFVFLHTCNTYKSCSDSSMPSTIPKVCRPIAPAKNRSNVIVRWPQNPNTSQGGEKVLHPICRRIQVPANQRVQK